MRQNNHRETKYGHKDTNLTHKTTEKLKMTTEMQKDHKEIQTNVTKTTKMCSKDKQLRQRATELKKNDYRETKAAKIQNDDTDAKQLQSHKKGLRRKVKYTQYTHKDKTTTETHKMIREKPNVTTTRCKTTTETIKRKQRDHKKTQNYYRDTQNKYSPKKAKNSFLSHVSVQRPDSSNPSVIVTDCL